MPERTSPSKSGEPSPLLKGRRDSFYELMLQAYESALAPRTAIYCSAPITSGRRYIEWLQTRRERTSIDELSNEERALHQKHVIEPNQRHGKQVADRLRQRSGKPVIDPTAVGPVEGWRQADWIAFWEEVIGRYVSELVMIEGWEYSFGCTHEFWFAQSHDLPCYNESISLISPSDAVRSIRRAIGELEAINVDAAKLKSVLRLLERAGS
jgi:hypothetical protein